MRRINHHEIVLKSHDYILFGLRSRSSMTHLAIFIPSAATGDPYGGRLVEVPVDDVALLVRWLLHLEVGGVDTECNPAEESSICSNS
jgi:hypothetical protein